MKPFTLKWWLGVFQEAIYYSKTKYFNKEEMEKDYELINFIRNRIIKKCQKKNTVTLDIKIDEDW